MVHRGKIENGKSLKDEKENVSLLNDKTVAGSLAMTSVMIR
jgi:hypothetical protein